MSLFDLTPAGIAPVAGEGCATGLSTAQYTGTIAWKTANGAHSGNFAVSTAYTAEITLTVKSGYTFDGVGANAFTYSGVAGVTNPAGQGSGLAVTIIFPATSDSVPVKVTALALNGHVTAPVRGAAPNTAAIATDQYTGTIAWKTANGAHSGNFAAETVYIAEVSLSVKSGYTFTGVAEDSFTYSGAAGVTNPAGQGSGLTVTITFPKTSGGEKITITSTEGLAVLLAGHAGGNSADEPVEAAAALELSEANWSALLNEINRGRKYVSLDLAACASSDNNSLGGLRPIGDFDPMPSISTGKAYIVNLTLPVQASGIVAGASETPTFSNFSALKTVSGEEVRTIGDSAFRDCDALTSVSLPAAETIGDSAFRGCGALTSVSLPAAESIGYSAFSGCDALTSVTMPATLYQEAFNNASFGGKIVWTLVERDGFIGPWSTLENGKLLVHYTTMLVYGRAASGSITLPASITSIGNRAFSGCDALTSVSLPAVVTIGDRAFDGCDALASVSLPAAESIGYSAFSGCGTLASVSLPAAESIGYSAFSGCSALASVSLPAAESIGYSAFYGCGTLASVSLPAAKTIDYRAFSGCGALASVSLPAAETIGDSAFRDCGALASVSLPAAESIDYRAFSGCGALTSVTLGATRPSLGSDILSNVSGTITVGIPSGSETAYGVSGYNNGDSAANNWGNAFRGRGSTSGYGTVNTSVSLVFETY